MPVDVESGITPLCIDLVCKERSKLKHFLNSKGVEISNFHPSIHIAPYYNGNPKNFENSEKFSSSGFMPPSGPSQPLENVDVAIKLIKEWINS